MPWFFVGTVIKYFFVKIYILYAMKTHEHRFIFKFTQEINSNIFIKLVSKFEYGCLHVYINKNEINKMIF